MRIVAAVLTLTLAGAASAAAQSSASSRDASPPGPAAFPVNAPVSAPGVGAPVRGAGGEVLGRIEAVVRDAGGQPVQVVVRTRGLAGVRAQSRAVPITSLRPDGSGWVLPLRRSEFQLLPAARP